MKNKLISTKSGKLLSWLHENSVDCFTYQDIQGVLTDSSESAIRELLSDMTRRGLLMRLKQGVYYVIPYKEDPDIFMPNWHLIVKYLVGNADYYIGYYSAMEIHNLTTQPSMEEQVVVSKQIRPSTQLIGKVPFQFVYNNEKHFFGGKNVWIDSFHKVKCSDIEKTLVDCLYKPDYAAGIVEIARALYTSKKTISFEILLKYVKAFDAQVVVKRLGFLLELLNIETPIILELLKMRTASVAVLDTELPRAGKIVSRWSILQNIDTETITSSLYT